MLVDLFEVLDNVLKGKIAQGVLFCIDGGCVVVSVVLVLFCLLILYAAVDRHCCVHLNITSRLENIRAGSVTHHFL